MYLKYSLNKELDKNIALEFLGLTAGGLDFTSGVTGPHPEFSDILNLDAADRKALIDSHFDSFYKHKSDELRSAVDTAADRWRAAETVFFEYALKLFGNKIQPKHYSGFISVVNCNPRFVDDNSFQFFWKHRWGSVFVSMHEILHFLFFDYARSVLGEPYTASDPNKGRFWEVSEVFNDIILSEKELVELHGVQTIDPYPALVPLLQEGRKIWLEIKNVDVLINHLYTWKT
jgi:hypothetical protein